MQMKHLVDEGTIERHSLIRITDYAVNHVQSRKVLIILGLEKYADPTTERLGNPQNVEAAAGATTNGAAPAAPAAAATAGAGAGAGARAGATSNYKSESSARDVKPQYNKTSNASLSNALRLHLVRTQPVARPCALDCCLRSRILDVPFA